MTNTSKRKLDLRRQTLNHLQPDSLGAAVGEAKRTERGFSRKPTLCFTV